MKKKKKEKETEIANVNFLSDNDKSKCPDEGNCQINYIRNIVEEAEEELEH